MRLKPWHLFLCLAIAACQPFGGARVMSAELAALGHGSWIYQVATVMGDDPATAAAEVSEWAARRSVTELYLALGPTGALLDDPGLPTFIAGLSSAGVSAEALIGDAAWTDPERRQRMLERIRAILAYNDPHGEGERFTAVHLDIENWTSETPCGSQPPSCWLPSLTDTYRDARLALEGSGVALAADINGTKLRAADVDARQAVFDASGRLLLMIYMQPLDRVERFATECLDGVDPQSSSAMVAIRPVDFAAPCDVLSAIDDYFVDTPGYAGASAFNYASYRALCP